MTNQMTTEQHEALNHWSMWGSDGYPIRKASNHKWMIVPEGFNLAICSHVPIMFKTKTAAEDYWSNLVITRSHEWRSAS